MWLHERKRDQGEKKRKEKKELSRGARRFIERRGARFAWHFVSCCTLSREEKEDCRESVKQKAACPGVVWCWKGCLRLHPLDIVPRLAACLPTRLAGPGPTPPPPPSLLFSIYPLMPSFTPASPPPRAFRSTVPALPWSCSGKKEDKRKELKRQWGFLDDKADCSFLCLKFNCFLDMLDC